MNIILKNKEHFSIINCFYFEIENCEYSHYKCLFEKLVDRNCSRCKTVERCIDSFDVIGEYRSNSP